MPVRGQTVLQIEIERWERREPFRIADYVFTTADCLVVSLSRDGATGRGEAAGVYYRGESVESIAAQLEAVRPVLEAGVDIAAVQRLLPPGGARNALDSAVRDLVAKLSGVPAWRSAGLSEPRPLLTTFTCGADSPERMASTAQGFVGARAIKLKLLGDAADGDRVAAVRAAMPEAWLAVDANQGFTRAALERLMPVLAQCRVEMIEQPFRIGEDALLDGFQSPIPIAADESAQTAASIDALVGRYQIVNIKLDKTGGLTGALAMMERAKAAGLRVMVGCMGGTSLAMAPALLIGQYCEIVDLDGPTPLVADREPAGDYSNGLLWLPETLWGYP